MHTKKVQNSVFIYIKTVYLFILKYSISTIGTHFALHLQVIDAITLGSLATLDDSISRSYRHCRMLSLDVVLGLRLIYLIPR